MGIEGRKAKHRTRRRADVQRLQRPHHPSLDPNPKTRLPLVHDHERNQTTRPDSVEVLAQGKVTVLPNQRNRQPRTTLMALMAGAEDLGLEVPPLSTIAATLNEFELEPAIDQLSKISCALSNGGQQEQLFQGWLFERGCSADTRKRVIDFEAKRRKQDIEEGNDRTQIVLFNARQLVIASKMVLEGGGTPNGRRLDIENDRYLMFDLLLSLSTHFSKLLEDFEEPSDYDDNQLWLFRHFQHCMEVTGGKSNQGLTAQHYVVERLLQDPEIMNRIRGKIEIDPQNYVNGVFGLLSFFSNVKPRYVMSGCNHSVSCETLFASIGLTRKDYEFIKDRHFVSTWPIQSRDEDRYSLVNLSSVIERPFVLLPNSRLVCIATDIAAIHFSRGLRKIVLDCFSDRKERGERILTPIGEIFEDYAREVVQDSVKRRESVDAKGGTKVSPAKNDLDCWYSEGSHVVLIECKASPTSLDVHLSPDWRTLKDRIHAKYLDKKEGVPQLRDRVERYMRGEYSDEIPKANVVWPVLIVEDELASSMLVSRYISRKSNSMLKDLGPSVKPVTVLHADDLHLALAISERYSLPDILIWLQKPASFQFITHENAIRMLWKWADPTDKILAMRGAKVGTNLIDRGHAQMTRRLKGVAMPKPRCNKCRGALERFTRLDVQNWICPSCEDAIPRPVTKRQMDLIETAYSLLHDEFERS